MRDWRLLTVGAWSFGTKILKFGALPLGAKTLQILRFNGARSKQLAFWSVLPTAVNKGTFAAFSELCPTTETYLILNQIKKKKQKDFET